MALPTCVKAGYVRHIGLSEVGADTIRRAGSRSPDLRPPDRIFANFARHRGRDPAGLPRTRHRRHGLRCAVARADQRHWQKDAAKGGDFRAMSPRFQEGNVERNLALVEALRRIAEAKGVTVAQIAIAWVAAQGHDIVPLVGARRRDRLAEALGQRGGPTGR